MKRLITIILLLSASLAVAQQNWWTPGTSSNPITAGYYTTIYGNTFLPLVSGTGSIGSAANAWNSSHQDSVFLADSVFAFKTAGAKRVMWVDTIHFTDRGLTANPLFINASSALECALAFKSTASVIATQGLYTETLMRALSTTAGVALRNEVKLVANTDNPYVAFRDSSAGAAPTRDSLVYNGASFDFTKPVRLPRYAKGVRPTTAEVGQLICIDGDSGTDSLLVYLGTTWTAIKPE